MDSPDGQTTRVRFVVMGYLCSLAYILYIDRICIGQAGTVIKAELGLTNFQWGLVGVAFQIAYAIFEPTTGHWGDRHGSRWVLTRIVLWWSAFTALTGCVWNFSVPLLRRASWPAASSCCWWSGSCSGPARRGHCRTRHA